MLRMFRKSYLSFVCMFVFMSAVPVYASITAAIAGAAALWATKKALDYLWDYMNEPDNKGDINIVETKADNGDPTAQYNLGLMKL